MAAAINFFMVFSPDAFRGAPVTRLATVTWPDGGDALANGAYFKEYLKWDDAQWADAKKLAQAANPKSK